ncbi:hypothetical protein Daus18300_013171 [Diaporthe australafricana]|uniref:F-box domain-containing protein n=1 Tax=Diaporthe australafricana TaxID=127596 RepID=A0ABR3VZZ6_9PEZI
MAQSRGQPSLIEGVPSPPSETIFPFMSLPIEIRLMVYDVGMPEEIHLLGKHGFTGIPPHIRALMRVKLIRKEMLPHFFSRYHFRWMEARAWSGIQPQRDLFKRYVIPFITSLSIHLERPLSANTTHQSSPKHLGDLIKWMRWRSQRSHLYPWHLKRLTLVEAHYVHTRHQFHLLQPPSYHPRLSVSHFSRLPVPLAGGNMHPALETFLTMIPVVPGLESLKIALNYDPGNKVVKAFLERCAGGGAEGALGYRQDVYQEEVFEWCWLKDDQIVHTKVPLAETAVIPHPPLHPPPKELTWTHDMLVDLN